LLEAIRSTIAVHDLPATLTVLVATEFRDIVPFTCVYSFFETVEFESDHRIAYGPSEALKTRYALLS